jgi:hypothetical protein
VADFGDPRNVFGAFGVRHGHGQLINVDGRPLRIPMHQEVLVVGTDGIVAKRIPQLANCLAPISRELAGINLEYPTLSMSALLA